LIQSFVELFNRRFAALWIASFVIGILSAPINALLAVYVEAEIGGTPLFSAGLRSTFLLLGGLFAVPAGFLCDRIGTKTTFILGSTGVFVAGFVFLAHQPAWLFMLCFYIGIAGGFSTTASQAYLIHAAPRASLGLGSAAFFIGMTLGTASGSRLAGLVVDSMGFQTIGLCISGMMVVVLISVMVFMPELQMDVPGKKRARATIHDYLSLLRRSNVRLLLWIRFLPTCYWGAATLLIPLLVYRATGALSSAANYTALSLVVASVCQIVIGRLSDILGPRVPTLVASSCVAVSVLCTGLFAESVAGLYVFGVAGAAAAWSVSTMMPRLIDAVSGPDEKGRVVGMAHLAWSFGMLSGSLWGGRAVEWSPGLPFYAVSVLCVITVVLLVLLFFRLEKQTAEVAG